MKKTYVIGRKFKIQDKTWTFIGQPNSAEDKYKKWCFFNESEIKRKCFSKEEMEELNIIPV